MCLHSVIKMISQVILSLKKHKELHSSYTLRSASALGYTTLPPVAVSTGPAAIAYLSCCSRVIARSRLLLRQEK